MSTFKIVYGVSTSASASRNRLCLYICVEARYQFCEISRNRVCISSSVEARFVSLVVVLRLTLYR